MAISHTTHDHPNTPAARAACRKALAANPLALAGTSALNPVRKLAEGAGLVKPETKWTVVPKNPAPRRLKVTGTMIKSVGDLADVPAVLAAHVRTAWTAGFTVQVGHPFNDDERRIVVTRTDDEIALVWSASTGRTGIFIRALDSSITRRVVNPGTFELV